METRGNERRNPCHREFMDKPKQRYPRSIARQLQGAPCPDCGRKSRPRLTAMPDFSDDVDPEVLATWHCPDNLCEQSDGFWIESRT